MPSTAEQLHNQGDLSLGDSRTWNVRIIDKQTRKTLGVVSRSEFEQLKQVADEPEDFVLGKRGVPKILLVQGKEELKV